jgi:hypothetical protein
MQCLALDNATGMAQSIHKNVRPESDTGLRKTVLILLENRSIARGNLPVHSLIPRWRA